MKIYVIQFWCYHIVESGFRVGVAGVAGVVLVLVVLVIIVLVVLVYVVFLLYFNFDPIETW